MNPFLILTLCFSTASILGCAEERAPIDRVQPYALDKSFVGESYTDTSDDPNSGPKRLSSMLDTVQAKMGCLPQHTHSR